MKRAFAVLVLDLSLPPTGDSGTGAAAASSRQVGAGLTAALRLLEADPALRLEVALAGGVVQKLLRWGEERALQLLAERASAGQVAFLSTAAWGAFLPLVPEREAQRQLDLSDAIGREALGDWVYRPEGLFPPQLGYSRSVADLAAKRGLSRVLADALALSGGGRLPRDRHFTLRGRPGFHVFFADRALSLALERGRLSGPEDLHRAIAPHRSGYAVLRVPARTLSVGAPPLRLLAAFSPRSGAAPAGLREILALFPEVEEVEPIACALGTDPGELASGVQFAKWSAPGNELHALLWRLAQLASEETERLAGVPEGGPMRARLDESLDCASWRFASGKPELDLARVARGAASLLGAIRVGGARVRPELLARAEEVAARLAWLCEVRPAASPAAPA